MHQGADVEGGVGNNGLWATTFFGGGVGQYWGVSTMWGGVFNL